MLLSVEYLTTNKMLHNYTALKNNKKNFTLNEYKTKILNSKEIISKTHISTVLVCSVVSAELTPTKD